MPLGGVKLLGPTVVICTSHTLSATRVAAGTVTGQVPANAWAGAAAPDTPRPMAPTPTRPKAAAPLMLRRMFTGILSSRTGEIARQISSQALRIPTLDPAGREGRRPPQPCGS